MTDYQLFATTPKAMEDILANELKALGAKNVKQKMAGVAFEGDLKLAYQACLWLRTASRVFLLLDTFEVKSQQDLYAGVQRTDWSKHLNADDSLAVSFNSKNNSAITHSHFGALKVKDAIVDQMRSQFGTRPDIDTERPSIRVNVYLHNEIAQLSLDLSGESLHKRGYRATQVIAPIKESLAAAMLLRVGWPAMAAQGKSLLDPMCGSGTLLTEGALIAGDIAPGLQRDYFGFLGWKSHDEALWQALLGEAQQRRDIGMGKLPVMVGFDQDRRTVTAALQHIENLGLQSKIHIEKRDISEACAAESWPKGLLICNPPYGERLGDEAQTTTLYRTFGEVLKQQFIGWQAAIIIGDPELGFRLGVRSQKPITMFNGALECKLLRLDIDEKNFFEPKAKSQQERIEQVNLHSQTTMADSQVEMFANRLRKNLKKLASWIKKNHIHCYRLYDADLPEYAVAIDVYHGEKTWVNVQEYEPPKSIDSIKATHRLAGVLSEISKVLEIPSQQVYLKIRRKQKNTEQYEKISDSRHFHIVEENGCKFWVNFEDYLDTGLFLDHRPMRLLIQQQAKDKRFLNLFAYTGTASVHAVMGGAHSTVTIDMSNTYLDWAKRNFTLNNITTGNHQFIRADCLEWLYDQAHAQQKPQFDLIFLDPPTFSNSKKMEELFDIQRDHVQLIRNAVALLSIDQGGIKEKMGILYFSTNSRRFKMDNEALSDLSIENISATTIPEDFKRDAKIHACWKITHK
ncbi:MAG TPA: bifunctional 23S rRNA (guanine(2069)-N(7))-methyltransferase RlmK/23S rRNA (guanine(2445)-N(2))-methyltransferase RlmL [Nitrosomonas sp.]|nr:bifunctional 23S rRNA (guanine(2069)-N(7))-methyltransferase RlmK/23S rRNA (guanine(2445)-N(2))-methyltransferase RlmL [Nitrosomonas sp.]HQX13494.1 bifunctional 23S rRNA (guanine(2069)-N(7))-methyltransferase RlmK/23S rRNA (guanine(2445)-N(2))-methyltransferase RlmL [Nitrosomonas sp.]HRB31948.1 bifunctional 23S rRNA (guanine(2069)-N(7))-methyltransferase RlmK/23S rRNA (guanine(2445)-N(2))-methyltransferase RlmL [Nitrosomonas sp.]HRB44781.1 bifunctional 23S rRNA (guanine(2069)-N(7))-methyltran